MRISAVLNKSISKFKNFISSHHNYLLKILIYGYLAIIIVIFIPVYSEYYWMNLTNYNISTNFFGDIEQYVEMANGNYKLVGAPYKFRFLTPFLWSLFLPIMPLRYSILIWNFIFLFGSSLLADRYLARLNFSNLYRIFGVIFVNVSFPVIQVAFTPNIDLAVLFFAFLFMVGVIEKNPWIIGIASLLGMVVKESILFLFPIFFIFNFTEIKESVKKALKEKIMPNKKLIISIMFLFLAFIEFLAIRGFIFNINYDLDLGQSEFPQYYERWLSSNEATQSLIHIFFTLTILWFAPLGYLIHRWKRDKWLSLSLYGVFVIFMISLLSARITRVSFFLIVIYLPIFLKLIKDFKIEQLNRNIDVSKIEESN